MKLNPIMRYYATENYIELFLPHFDNIIRVEKEGIIHDWDYILNSSSNELANTENELALVLKELGGIV